ncbi:regucalcin-like isoform X2 [Haliotis rubra]|uniref:regucalcin-like isoform X2 n=1 Tax=Haliotis rubra TaxID=36100 RepID=UPI001EE53E73|nr:regucalcin-like isoform X2 [Haliotis rubra]
MPYKVETVLKDAVSTIGEAPHWDDATQTLLYVDILKGDIHRYDPANGKVDVLHLDGGVGFVNFVVPRKNGALVAGSGQAFVSVDWETKTVTKLAEVDPGTNNKLNDGKCDARGRVWAGTLDGQLTPHKGNLYCLDIDGSVSKQDENFTTSNGMAWSPDNNTMYFIDTSPREVYAYDYDIEKGKICKMLQKVDIPDAKRITSVCWGGKNLDELYLTTLKMHPTRAAFPVIDSLDGSLFRVTGLGVHGLPAEVYRG